jgi:hypothetical protein
MTMWYSHAAPDGVSGPANAYQRSYVQIDLKSLFATPQPSSHVTAASHVIHLRP